MLTDTDTHTARMLFVQWKIMISHPNWYDAKIPTGV